MGGRDLSAEATRQQQQQQQLGAHWAAQGIACQLSQMHKHYYDLLVFVF